MAILKPINSKANTKSALKSLLNYISDPKKTADGLYVFGKDCLNEKTYESMMTVKEHFRKTEGRQCLHYTHSFPPSDNVSPQLAFDIGREFVMNCKKLQDFQVLLAVHTNEDHMHLHYVINSVSQTDGRKWQNSPKDLELMRDFSDTLCTKYGLSVLEKGGNYNKHYAEHKGNFSWKKELAKDISECANQSHSWLEFAERLSFRNISFDFREREGKSPSLVYEVEKGYCGVKQNYYCSPGNLKTYGDVSEQNINRLMQFHQTSDAAPLWTNEVVGSLLDSFYFGENTSHIQSDTRNIDWKSMSWLEVQETIAMLKAKQMGLRTAQSVEHDKQQSKQNYNYLKTIGEDFLKFYQEWCKKQEYYAMIEDLSLDQYHYPREIGAEEAYYEESEEDEDEEMYYDEEDEEEEFEYEDEWDR